ncbi:MAG: rhodanese-like domain-containing protein [Melioribacter sp.]|nr:rhodanese-like domain-containing protein [Melioribacter sp.]
MKCPIEKLSINKRLALFALVLGIIALFIGNTSSYKINVNAKELALSTVRNQDKISVIQLAEWIIEGKADYVLVDLRDEKSFNEYSIPNAINIKLENILDSGLMRNEKIILFGLDDITSAQAWFILKSANYKYVYILKGGINEWKEKILFPRLVENASQKEKEEFEKIKQISFYFGGIPQVVSGASSSEIYKIQSPTVPKVSPPPAGSIKSIPKKKREGC